MTIKNGDMPAGPQCVSINDAGDAETSDRAGGEGLTKREHFAAMAMQGLIANSGGPIQHSPMSGFNFCNCGPDDVADIAIGIADALLKGLEKCKQE